MGGGIFNDLRISFCFPISYNVSVMTINYLSVFKIKTLTWSRENMEERPWDLATSKSSAFGKHVSSIVERKARSQKGSGKTGCSEKKNMVNLRLVM